MKAQASAATVMALAAAGNAGPAVYDGLKRGLKAAVARDPFDTLVAAVLGGAFLFYAAEKGRNPKVTSYWDALVFVSTCASVGYADVFARTPAGKAIAAAMMTVGPALSGALFDGGDVARAAPSPKDAALAHAIIGRLDAVLAELRRARGSTETGEPDPAARAQSAHGQQ